MVRVPPIFTCRQQTVFAASLSMVIALDMFAACIATPLPVNQDALQRIPDDAYGFVVVNNIAQTNTKVDQLLKHLEVTFPAPWTLIKTVTGLEEGIDAQGSLVIALLPNVRSRSTIEPLVLLPVSDYAAFAQSIQADESGEVCRVTLLGEDLYVAKDGPYAMFMNIEHRAKMESLLALPSEPLDDLAPLSTWLSKQDIAVTLLPTGINWLNDPFGYRSGAKRRSSLSPKPLLRTRNAYLNTTFLRLLRSHTHTVAVGVHADKQLDIRLSQQLVPKKNSWLAWQAGEKKNESQVMLGLLPQPFVFAAGGAVEKNWVRVLTNWLSQNRQSNLASGQKIAPELLKQEKQIYHQILDDITSCSFMMLPGKKGEPLAGNLVGIAEVPDTEKYLISLTKVCEKLNKLAEQSGEDIKFDYLVRKRKIAGKRGVAIESDISKAIQETDVPVINWMVEAVFGPTGKLQIQVVAIDTTTLAVGLATENQMENLIARLQQKKTNTPALDNAQKTLQLMQSETDWKALIQPQNCLAWASRLTNEFFSLVGADEMNVRDLPDSPPIGLTIGKSAQTLESELVCPIETLKILVDNWPIVDDE